MRIALAGILLLLAACSPTRQIAIAANDVGDRAEAIHRLADRIGSTSTEPATVRDAADIVIEARAIQASASRIHRVLPDVEDQTPWWATVLQTGFWAVVVVAVAVIIWQTGIGQAFRAAIGWIPRRKSQEASLAAAALDPQRAEGLRELISAKRVSDPLFDAAWRKETQDGSHS